MSWYDEAYSVMLTVWQERKAAGDSPEQIGKAIDAAYPFGERRMWPYKQWLKARKDFFTSHYLPRRAQRLPPDLLTALEAFTGQDKATLQKKYGDEVG